MTDVQHQAQHLYAWFATILLICALHAGTCNRLVWQIKCQCRMVPCLRQQICSGCDHGYYKATFSAYCYCTCVRSANYQLYCCMTHHHTLFCHSLTRFFSIGDCTAAIHYSQFCSAISSSFWQSMTELCLLGNNANTGTAMSYSSKLRALPLATVLEHFATNERCHGNGPGVMCVCPS